MYKADMAKYKIDLENWQMKMMKEGKTQLLPKRLQPSTDPKKKKAKKKTDSKKSTKKEDKSTSTEETETEDKSTSTEE